MTKRALVYARVSTDDQAERGFSLSAQIEAGRKYAEVHGMTVTNELIDDGVSGARAFSERPSGATAWTMLRQRQADALVVQNVDRLSRDVVDLLVTIRELLRAGVEVHCLDLGRVTSEYDIMLVIRGWQGSDERAKIRERSIRGKRTKASQGMVVAVGKPPYGYEHLRDDKGRVVNFSVNEERAAIVRLIFQLYTRGDDDGGTYSLYAIAKRLSQNGVPAPSTENRKNPRHIWNEICVGRILSSKTYIGEWQYRANQDEQFAIQVPAIVDTATWELAQIQRERNRRKAKRNAKHEYLLSGIIRCGCGRAMVGITPGGNNSRNRYYFCNTNVRLSGVQERKCFEKVIRADELEAATWDAILNLIQNPEEFEAKLREAQQKELEDQEPKRVELETVLAMMAEAEAEAAALTITFTKLTATGKEDGIVSKTLQDKIASVDERYKQLSARRDELTATLDNRRLTDALVDAALRFAADVARGIDDPNHATKRATLDLFDARVVVTDGKAVLWYTLPVEASIELHLSLCASHSPDTTPPGYHSRASTPPHPA